MSSSIDLYAEQNRRDRMQLRAGTAPALLRAPAAASEGWALVGLAIPYGQVTAISDIEGRYDEVCAPGAFSASIRSRRPLIQYDHGGDPRVGSTPIAHLERIWEESDGLHVVARLFDNDIVRPIQQALAAGALHGMSVRMSIDQDEWTDQGRGRRPLRTIRAATLYECGVVAFPAYPTTSAGVRLAADKAERERVLAKLGIAPMGPGDRARVLASRMPQAALTPAERERRLAKLGMGRPERLRILNDLSGPRLTAGQRGRLLAARTRRKP